MKDLLFPILSVIITIVGFQAILETQPEYDFRKTIVKVIGNGHGSGSVIDTNLAKSLILTNRHVCNGITMTQNEMARIGAAKFHVFVCKLKRDSDCLKKAQANLVKLQKELGSVGRKVTIMFNNHIIESVKGVPSKVKGTIKYVGKDVDLCLVEVNYGQLPVIKISERRAKPGDKVFALGNPLFMTNHMTEGYVGDEINHQGNVYQHHTAIIHPGSSGSPAVNVDKELVGINTLGTRISTSSYIIPLEDVLMFLKGKMIHRKISTKLEI